MMPPVCWESTTCSWVSPAHADSERAGAVAQIRRSACALRAALVSVVLSLTAALSAVSQPVPPGVYTLTSFGGSMLPSAMEPDAVSALCPQGSTPVAAMVNAGTLEVTTGVSATLQNQVWLDCLKPTGESTTLEAVHEVRANWRERPQGMRLVLFGREARNFFRTGAPDLDYTAADQTIRFAPLRAEWRESSALAAATTTTLPPRHTGLPEGDPILLLEQAMALASQSTSGGDRSAASSESDGCWADPSPRSLPPTTTADTAGFGSQFAEKFAGHRLATEAEVGCRLDTARHGPVNLSYPAWGSGEAWWIWTADFDGDGRDDRLTVLVNEQGTGRLGVLFANGAAAFVASEDELSRPIKILERGEELAACVDLANDGLSELTLSAAAVELYLDVYYWRDTEFVGFHMGC